MKVLSFYPLYHHLIYPIQGLMRIMVETPVPLPKPPLRKRSPLSSLRTRAEFHSSPADPSENTKEMQPGSDYMNITSFLPQKG
jgi:hypothetical protein